MKFYVKNEFINVGKNVFPGDIVDIEPERIEGLKKAKEVKPTLILLDIMMPKMHGLEVLEKLKSDDSTKKVPVVILTNLAGEQDAEAALAKGAVKYLVKSEHDPKEVAEEVKQILAGYTREKIPEVKESKKK